jgi:glutaminase
MEDTTAATLRAVHETHRAWAEGALPSYIPELQNVDPDAFGIAACTAEGAISEAGDSAQPFTLQSISKALVYGMVLDAHGAEVVGRRISVEPSGDAFDALHLEPRTGRAPNPLVNAGAIAATGLIPGRSLEDRFERILDGLSVYAGRRLDLDAAVYRSESATGHRNRALAHLLRSAGLLDDPLEATLELYFMQCSIRVTCRDLAVMGATLAHGGINPLTGDRALHTEHLDKVLSVMSTCGMYDASGRWMYEVGFPAKSGVGGGIFGALPGRMGVATFSPRLDPHGHSVRGVRALRDLSRDLGLHIFRPAVEERPAPRPRGRRPIGHASPRLEVAAGLEPRPHRAAPRPHGPSPRRALPPRALAS